MRTHEWIGVRADVKHVEMGSISQTIDDVATRLDHSSPYQANIAGLRIFIPNDTHTISYGTLWIPAPIEEQILGSTTPVYKAVAYDADSVEIPLLRLEDLLRSIQRGADINQA